MSKILDSTLISGTVPKIIETSQNFIINSQVYDKQSLEPIKFKNIYDNARTTDLVMNTNIKLNDNHNMGYSSDNCIVLDQYDSEISFIFYSDRSGYLRISKYQKRDGEELLLNSKKEHSTRYVSYIEVYSQDLYYIYGMYINTEYENTIFRIDKRDLNCIFCNLIGKYSKVKLLKDTPLSIYYAASYNSDNFVIGRYNKNNNTKTDLFVDNRALTSGFDSYFLPMSINENEVLTIRTNRSEVNNGIDTLYLKKYILDYEYEKVYSKSIELDCSLIDKDSLPRINSQVHFTYCKYFKKNNNEYFYYWNKTEKKLYLIKKISDVSYKVIQMYDMPNNYFGICDYNNGEVIIAYNDVCVDFFVFRTLEEKYETSTTLKGSFYSLGIDKNHFIWVQEADGTVERLGLSLPTIAEALFVDQELNYSNNDIQTFIEVYAKSFNGSLIETTVQVILDGPIYFSDTFSRKKIMKTSSDNVVRLPVTITNAGLVETNIKIL